jgi:hypothetical protein
MTTRDEAVSFELLAAGSAVEALGGAAAAVLAILGLATLFPMTLSAVATIAVGAALLAEGAAIASRYARLLAASEQTRLGAVEIGGGMSAEFVGGAAGVVLGLLALLSVAPITLTAVAVIVFGGALLLGCGTVSRVSPESGAHTGVGHEVVMAASGAQVLVGLGSIVLGIVALVGIVPETLILVALLSVGTTIVLSGSAIAARLATLLRS